MMEFVSWDDDIPSIWKFIKKMFQTTNQMGSHIRWILSIPHTIRCWSSHRSSVQSYESPWHGFIQCFQGKSTGNSKQLVLNPYGFLWFPLVSSGFLWHGFLWFPLKSQSILTNPNHVFSFNPPSPAIQRSLPSGNLLQFAIEHGQ